MTVQDQYRAAGETDDHIAQLIRSGWEVAITHGNGPQVGFILRRSELAAHELHEVPLHVCGADSQGAIGYALHLASERLIPNGASMSDILDGLETIFDEDGLDALASARRPGEHPGNFARPRRFEIAAALNRLRSLEVER